MPKNIPLRKLFRVRASCRTTFLVTVHGPAINHSRLRTIREQTDLRVYRAGQPQVVVVEETYVFGSACDDPDISRSANTQSPGNANIANIREAATYFWRLIFRGIIYHDYLYTARSPSGAFNRAQEQLAPVSRRYDDTYLRHLLEPGERG